MAARGIVHLVKSRKGRRPMRVGTLLRKEKEGTLFHTTSPHAKRGDVPTRSDIEMDPKSENRQDYQSSWVSDKYASFGNPSPRTVRLLAAAEIAGLGMIAAPEIDNIIARNRARKAGALNAQGDISEHKLKKFRTIDPKFDKPSDVAGLGVLAAPYVRPLLKGAEALGKDRALGDQPKKWEGPTRPDVGAAMPEKHKGQGGFVNLTDISTSVGQDESKTSSVLGAALVRMTGEVEQPKEASVDRSSASVALVPGIARAKVAMVDELNGLNVLTQTQLQKVAKEIGKEEAEKSLKHLEKIEANKPTIPQVGRGALVGAVVGPLANLAVRAASGARGRAGAPIWLGTRAQAAGAAHGAIYGSVLPIGKDELERRAERRRLQAYVAKAPSDPLASKIKKTVEV